MVFNWKWSNQLVISIKPIFFFCQLYGLHFSGIGFDKKRPTSKFKKNLLRIYSLGLLIFIVTVFLYQTNNLIISDVNVIVQVWIHSVNTVSLAILPSSTD